MSKFMRKHLLAIGVGAIVLVATTTIGVFAAIPDSVTGRITGCRNNNTSTLKVIDAQNGATCSANETMLSWWSTGATTNTNPTPKTAIFHLTADSSDPDFNHVYDPTLSRGIIAAKKLVANDPVNNPTDNRGYCVELGFTVLYSSSPNGAAVYETILPGVQAQIDELCGPGFDAFIQAWADEKAVFFAE